MRADPSGRTGITDLRQSGALKLVFPRQLTNSAETILVNTAGGITGGDRYDLDIDVGAGAALSLTTQAAERAYRAQRGETGKVTTRITVQSGAQMNWLPQELILFERCALNRRLSIDLQGDARLLMVEPVVFGRAAMKEVLRDIHLYDRISITRDGRPLYLDAMKISGDAAARLARSAIANGAGAMASVLCVTPEIAANLSAVREMLPATAGASLIAPDTLVIRQLAQDSYMLRRSLMPLLEHLSQSPLPASWRL
ncbi:urease accessory protein UreD [Amylibacter cionae]|uniref:Urease accessory protein UreD n=1 Tax=Neptunicoccus cionae TaxID=2035344 RepID=A0A916R286_9RHOB|nr:urease accessory protein UreD [Amylibacter cionae]